MATRIIFPTVHADGSAVEASIDETSFILYDTGGPSSPPTPVVFDGAGKLWGFLPSAGDEAALTLWLLDIGSDGGGPAQPQKVFGTIPAVCRRIAVGFRDATGQLIDTGAPSFLSFKRQDESAASAPTIIDTGEGLYHFLISEADAAAGVRWAIQAGVDGPANGVVELIQIGSYKTPVIAPADDVDPPSITVIGPPSGSAITANQAIQVRVTDEVAVRRSIVTARFGGIAIEEVVWNGERFGALYTGSTKTNVAGGYELTIRRTGGWPAGPVLDVFAIDTSGNEA